MSTEIVEQPLTPPWQIDHERTALLVIDMENDFVAEGGAMEVPAARLDALPNIKQLIAVSRTMDVPVIYTTHVLTDDFDISPLECTYNTRLQREGMRDGTPGVEIYPEIAPRDDEVLIRKHRYDAFYNTSLETVIRNVRGSGVVDTLMITGTVTNVCCESTARSAFMRDFKVAFVDDACGGLDQESHDAACRSIGLVFGRVLMTQQAVAELRGT